METLGFEAVNPCDLNHAGHDQTWESYMRVDIIALMGCEAICLLPGWDRSAGAKCEYHLAQVLGMDVLVHADGPELTVEAAMDADIVPDDINIHHRNEKMHKMIEASRNAFIIYTPIYPDCRCMVVPIDSGN